VPGRGDRRSLHAAGSGLPQSHQSRDDLLDERRRRNRPDYRDDDRDDEHWLDEYRVNDFSIRDGRCDEHGRRALQG